MRTDETLSALQRHLRALWRAEMLIAEIKIGAIVKKSVLMIAAGLIALFGLVALHIAAYQALAPLLGEVWALVTVAAGDFVIAILLILMASGKSSAPELPLAIELRDQAIAGLELDARFAMGEVSGLVLRPLRMARTVSSVLASILSAVLRARRAKRDG